MHNLKLILKTYSALRQMNPDDLALLETLRKFNDGEREAFVETLSDKPQKKSSKKSAGKSSARCQAELVSGAACNMAASHGIHDPDQKHNYGESHKFLAKKSPRASSLSEAVKGNLQRREPTVGGFADDADMVRCTREIGDEKGLRPCGEEADANIHHLCTHPLYHSFSPPVSSVDNQSTPGTSGTLREDVTDAVHVGD